MTTGHALDELTKACPIASQSMNFWLDVIVLAGNALTKSSLVHNRSVLRQEHNRRLLRAQMAELVDAPASGAGTGNGVEVRVLFWAPFQISPRLSPITY